MPNTTAVPGAFASNDLLPTLLEITERKVWPQIMRTCLMYTKFYNVMVDKVNSRDRRIVLHLRDGQPGTFRPQGAGLLKGKPDLQKVASFGYTKYQRGFAFTPEVLEEMDSDTALMNLEARMNIYEEAIKSELSAFFYGTGSGAVAELSGALTDNADGTWTVPLKNSSDTYGGVGSAGSADVVFDADYEIRDSSASFARITANSGAVKQFTVISSGFSGSQVKISLAASSTFSAAPAAGDILVPPGTYSSSNVSYALHGLGYHLTTPSTTSWQGLNPSTDPELRSVTKNANTADLTLGMANFIEDIVFFRRGGNTKAPNGEDKTLILCPKGQETLMRGFLNFHKRADWGEKVMKTGSTAVENQVGNRWTPDDKCPDTRIFHLTTDCFSTLTIKPGLHFFDTKTRDNMVLRGDSTGETDYVAVYDGWFQMYLEFISKAPFKQALLYNLGTSKIYRRSDYTRSV